MLIKSVALEVDGLKISGQFYLPEGGQAPYPTVCVCHGIPTEKPDPSDKGYPSFAERICHQGFAVLIFNFRGTGASGGNFDILGWTRDLKAALDYLFTQPEVDKSRLSLLGFSGGDSRYIINRANQPEAIEPFFGGMRKILVPDGTNAAEVVDNRLRTISFSKEGKLCQAATGDNA